MHEGLLKDAGRRRRVVDDHMFNPGLAQFPHARFRLQVFTAPGLRPVAVATQTAGEGPSLINGAEQYAQAAWRQTCPQELRPPIWVQRFLMDEAAPGRYAAQWVELEVVDGVVQPALRGCGVTEQELAELVGQSVDLGRGDRAEVERPVEPVMVLEPTPVVTLPRPDRDADRACRPAGISRRQVWIRQLRPRRGGTDCCWYHGGDWHEVSAAAIEALSQAHAAGVEDEDLALEALRRAKRTGWDGWRWEALESLLIDPIQVDEEAPDRHVNGRHRTQAMLEAGVRRTVVGHWPRYPAGSPPT